MLKFPAVAQPVFSSSSTQYHAIGTRGEDRFGRTFHYVKAGDVALVVGNALQAAVENTAHQALTAVAGSAGDKTLTMGLGASAAVANQYAGGLAVISTTPGIGYSYPIKGHPANAGSLAFTVTLEDGWPLQVDLTTSSRITLYTNPYKAVIQCPVTTATGPCVGCCQYIIGAAEYGWIGTKGAFGTLINGTPAMGSGVTNVAAVPGAVAIVSSTLGVVGTMIETGVDTKVNGVFWNV